MNTALIMRWITIHSPKGREKLAAGAEISISLVDKIVKRGHQPGLEVARRLAKVMKVSLDELSTQLEKEAPPAA